MDDVEEDVKEMDTEKVKEVLTTLRALSRQTFRLKVCCHKKGLPEMCETIELPFKPQNGDIVSVRPPTGDPESRLTLVIHGLIYDHGEDRFVMRPDIISDMNHKLKEPEIVDTDIDPLE
jgi:hypothetical protein